MQTVQTPSKSGVGQAQPDKQQGSADSGRMQIFFHALAFVLGFSIVFTLFGSAAGLVGRSMNQYLIYLQRFGAILLVIFALSTMGVFRWLADYLTRATDLETNPAAAALVSILSFFNGLMYGERRVVEMHEVNRGYGYLSSMLLGMSFSAGWAPCIGPILAGILFLAGDSATVTTGAVLLGVYSLGLGIPFLITGAAFSTTTKWLRKINRYSNSIGFVSGIFLLLVAFLLWTDSLATLTTRFSFLNEMVFGLEEALVGGTGAGIDIFNVNLASALPLAFTAGIISFISPCVLPLVPAYLGYLSGTAVSSRR